MKAIPFFNYPASFISHKKSYINIFSKICSNGKFILQEDLSEFERKISKLIRAKYVLGVANGTDAIWLGLKACGIKEGDEIIIPSHTYVATAAAIKMLNANPVLCECKLDGMMDANDIESRITKKTVAIMPVQLNGRVCDMDKIIKIAKKYKLLIFEDAAQALGAKYRNKHASTFGEFGTISLYPAKLLGCFGDGGLIVTNKLRIYKKLVELRDHGRNKNGIVKSWGFNSRLDNIQAAFLNYRLKNFQKEIMQRRKLEKIYHEKLSSNKNLLLPPIPSTTKNFDVFQNFEILAKNRDQLKVYLKKKKIGTLIQWSGKPLHKINSLKFKKKSLTFTDEYFQKCLMLPMHSFLKKSDVLYICNKINEFYQ